jgi:hypothetical protein
VGKYPNIHNEKQQHPFDIDTGPKAVDNLAIFPHLCVVSWTNSRRSFFPFGLRILAAEKSGETVD